MAVVLTVVITAAVVQALLGAVPGTQPALEPLGVTALITLAIQIIHSVPAWRRWRGWWTLAAQLVLLPFGGIAEFTAASCLIVVRGWYRWPLFAATVGFAAYDADTGNTFLALAYLANASTLSLIVFALTRLSELRSELAATRDELSRRRVAEERAHASQTLSAVLGTALASVIALASKSDIAGIASVTREAAARARQTPSEPAELPRTSAGEEMTPRLVLPIVAIAHVQALVLSGAYLWQAHMPGWERLAILTAALITLVLHFYHFLPRPTGARPRSRAWTLPTQCVLSCLPLLAPDRPYPDLIVLAVASLLIAMRPWTGWPLALAVAALVPLAGMLREQTLAFGLLNLVNLVFGVAMFYGLAILVRLVYRTRELRRQLAAVAVAAERNRIARDVHDVLGSTLAAITLKAEAHADVGEIDTLARRALRELRAIPDGQPGLDLESEMESARDLLAAAEVSLDVRVCRTPPSQEIDATLATVLRESITNLLRHSNPRHCVIEVDVTPARTRLRVANDGAPATAAGRGSGLANLNTRVSALDGCLRHGRVGEWYEVVVLQPIGLGGDPDSVEPVAGSELGDDRGQIVPDRPL